MAEMNELYDQNAYLKEFDARVISCIPGKKRYEIILDQTAFYPEGGGQPADHGKLNDVCVMDVHKKDGKVVHYTDAPLEEGSQVHGVIDWERRFDLMQNHTGEHIVSGLIHINYGYDNVGFHMGDVIQIDFNGPLDAAQIADIELQANRVIQNNTAVESLFPEAQQLEEMDYRSKKELEGTVRIVRIAGADVCACCGTHVRTAGEIGVIKILGFIKHKDGVRIEMISGMRAFRYIQQIGEQNHAISVALSAEPLKTAASVIQMQNALGQKEGEIRRITGLLLEYKLKEYAQHEGAVIDFEESLDRISVRKFGNDLADLCGTAAVLTRAQNGWNYFIVSRDKNLKVLVSEMNAALEGRGGGAKEMIQGSFRADEETIREVLEDILNR